MSRLADFIAGKSSNGFEPSTVRVLDIRMQNQLEGRHDLVFNPISVESDDYIPIGDVGFGALIPYGTPSSARSEENLASDPQSPRLRH